MLGAAALLQPIPAPSTASPGGIETTNAVTRWRPFAIVAASRFSVPIEWIERVMHAESRGRTHSGGRPITSHAGALGLLQLMPGTWAEMRQRLSLGNDPHDPGDNILAGAAYLRLMYDRFGYPGLFAAYNAGPARYASALAGRRPLPAETRAYVSNVAGSVDAGATTTSSRPLQSLFTVKRGGAVIAPPPSKPPRGNLFFPLSSDRTDPPEAPK